MGSGAASRLSAVRWGVARNIVVAWLLTLPAAGACGAAVYEVTRLFGDSAVGTLVVLFSAVAVLVTMMARAASRRRLPEPVAR